MIFLYIILLFNNISIVNGSLEEEQSEFNILEQIGYQVNNLFSNKKGFPKGYIHG